MIDRIAKSGTASVLVWLLCTAGFLRADERVDLHGDPLPQGALLRLGTARLRHEPRGIYDIACSRDGRLLATTEGGEVRLWSVATGAPLRGSQRPPPVLDERAARFMAVAFSPRSDELAARRADGTIVIWDVANDELVSKLVIDAVPDEDPALQHRGFAYSPTGNVLALNWNRQTLLFDKTSGQLLQTVGDGDRSQFGLAWSPTGTYLARGSRVAPARLWNVSGPEPTLVRPFEIDFDAFVLSLAISRDGRTLAAGCLEGQRQQILVCLWDVATGKLKARLPSEDAVSIHFTPDGRTLVSATEAGSIDVWDVEAGTKRFAIRAGLGTIRSAALTPDGKTVAIGSATSEIGMWDIETGQKKLEDLAGHHRPASQVAYAPSGEVIATTAENGDVRLWEAASGKQRRRLDSLRGKRLAFDPSGRRLATGAGWSGDVELWDVPSGERTRVLTRGEAQVRQFTFSSDGSRLITIGSDSSSISSSQPLIGRVHVWDVTSGEHIREFEFTAASTESMLLLPDNRTLVLGAAYSGESRAMQVLDLEKGTQIVAPISHEGAVNSLAFRNGILASGSWDRTIRLWDVATWKTIGVLEGHAGEVRSVAFSPDGKSLASCDSSGFVLLWDVGTRARVHEYPRRDSGCLSVCFAPDGKRIATSQRDSTSLVWEVPQGGNR